MDKPSGLFVHRTTLDASVRDVLLTRVRDQLGRRVFPVHRLDRPTSGCVILAFSSEAAALAQQALTTADKRYLALVRGQAHRLPELIDRPLRPPEKAAAVPAQTRFEVLARCDEPRCALVRARPLTGRFHQIRRHLAGAGHPVILDSTHGDTRIAAAWRARGLNRLFLHCTRLHLPDLGIEAHSPLPDELVTVLDGIGVKEQVWNA